MIRVILDGGACEPVASQRINMAYDAGTLTDMQAWREGRSLTVRLPSTTVTDRLMCNADDIHSPERFNSRLHTASVEVDGVELLRGTATLRSVVRTEGQTYYDVMIRDGGAEWARSASLTMLRDSEVAFSTLLDSAGIASTWQGDKAVRFLPVVRDSYSSDSTAEGLLLPQQMLMPQEYHPFLSVEAILRSIFRSAGYELCSEFMQSSLFKSLYMSGAYEDVDAAAARAKMDFLAGRQAAATATADAEGMVYAWEPKFASNIGAFVDTATPPPDIEPAEVRSGLFSTGGCMSFVDGRPQFKPTREICVGFEYYIKYATEYRIASRTRLRGFDAVHVDRDCDIDIGLANPFEDRRGELQPLFQYRVVVFDHKTGDKYRLGGLATFASRTALITTPSDVAADLPLTVCRSGETTYRPYDGDWALYDGYIEECGTRDVELRVRTPPEQLSPSSPKVFNFIYFHGAEEGQQLTLSERCTLRPIFSGEAGYGSVVSFADVACHKVRQSELIEALCQMFNLHIYSDQNARRVYIEPYDDFFGRHTEDWRGRQLTEGEQRWSDTMLDRHELQTWRYGDGDGVVGRFGAAGGNELGQWTFATEGCGTLLGRQTHLNPLFHPSVSQRQMCRAAPSAAVIRAGDRDSEVEEAGITPRIVIYAGMGQLPEGERWGYPITDEGYPLAAFHFAGDELNEGFTLCFEDRDSLTGLHRYYDAMLRSEAERQTFACGVRLSPAEYADLFDLESGGADIRSWFRLAAGESSSLFTLAAIDSYDPQTEVAQCRFQRVMRD